MSEYENSAVEALRIARLDDQFNDLPMPVWVNSGRCGVGKTAAEMHRMATTPGHYILVTDRVDVMRDRLDKMRSISLRHGLYPEIMALHAAQTTGKHAASPFGVRIVRQAIEFNGKMLADKPHAIMIVTHESLKMVDWGLFDSRWDVVIDEVPALLDTASLCTSGSVAWFRENFHLEPLGKSGWSVLRPKADIVTIDALAADDNMKDLVPMVRRAMTGKVYGNITSWADTAKPKKSWTWFSMWSPLELRHLRRVTFLANQFHSTMTAILLKRFFGDRLEFRDVEMEDTRVWQRRPVKVRYFVEEERGGTTTHWKDGEAGGKDVLRKIGEWLRSNTPEKHIFMCNESVEDILMAHAIPGHRLTPKQAGSNEWSSYHCATMIYSSKASPQKDMKLFAKIGVTKDDVRRAREFEDLLQFAYRLSLRDNESSEPVEVRVYDKAQATFLAETLAASGYMDVSVEVIDEVGVADHRRKKTGVQRVDEDGRELPPKTAAERSKEYRERKKAEAIAAGKPIRRRGRPTKGEAA